MTPNGHPDLSLRHADLGVSYIDRFQRLGELKDLEKAVEHESRALALTPDGHPSLPERHFNRAETLFLQYQHTEDPHYLKLSLDSFRNASQFSAGAPRDKFQYALSWAKRASEHNLTCIEAYQATMNILPQFIWLGATTTQRYHDLWTAEDLAVNAASAAILHSDYKLALEWLEHARCVVWNQTLMLRSPVDELQTSHPDLAARLQEVSKQLHDAGTQSATSQTFSSNLVDREQVAQRRLRLAGEYNDLLAQTRKLPGFGDFLRPMKADRLVRAARSGPIVVINCHKNRCDALLILPGQGDVKLLPLPNFTAKKAQKARSELESSLRRKGLRQRGFKVRLPPGHKASIANVLLVLWKDVVKPVLDFLEFKNDSSMGSLPHITWCPTGPMSFLPLHAAGDYDQPGSSVFNYVISSYTPTLTALIGSTPSTLNSVSRVLAIGQAKTPGHTPLPGTAKELKYVKSHVQNKAEYLQLVDHQANTTNVLDAMEQHDWVHLACHAHQNVEDPTKSGFFLHDGTLDLTSINQHRDRRREAAR
ncbi:unnamed protein product [Rhizoctonia solani]|uniref:CHAT domain-containing protein n=1 Tax=Rhizoctonia solani TaxID=456999 RepID=A0A8H3DQ32_9AGAM|nr:unnamed protein product [Rhizoctonia solani]